MPKPSVCGESALACRCGSSFQDTPGERRISRAVARLRA